MTATLKKTIFFKFSISIPKGEQVTIEGINPNNQDYYDIRRKNGTNVIYTIHKKHLKL